MKIKQKVGLIAVVLLYFFVGFHMVFHKNPSANKSHQIFSELIKKEIGSDVTQEMIDEGNLILSKFTSPDYEPRFYEKKQPVKVFWDWYFVTLEESKGNIEGVSDLRRNLNDFLASEE